MVKTLQSARKKGNRSFLNSSDQSIHKKGVKYKVRKDKFAKDDLIVLIPYCTDQINELKRKVHFIHFNTSM